MLKHALTAAGAVWMGVACAARQPPPELVDARAVYTRVALSDATRFAPHALDNARIALAAAEEPYQKGAPAYLVRDRAYVAMRSAEFAEALASTERTEDEIARGPGRAADLRERVSAAERKLEPDDSIARANGVEPVAERPPARGPTASLSIDDEARGTVITMPAPALFREDSAEFLPGAETRLEPVARALTDEQQTKILVETHDGSVTGSVDPGLALRRADHLRNFLVSHDVKPDRVSVEEPKESAVTPALQETNGRPNIVVRVKTPAP